MLKEVVRLPIRTPIVLVIAFSVTGIVIVTGLRSGPIEAETDASMLNGTDAEIRGRSAPHQLNKSQSSQTALESTYLHRACGAFAGSLMASRSMITVHDALLQAIRPCQARQDDERTQLPAEHRRNVVPTKSLPRAVADDFVLSKTACARGSARQPTTWRHKAPDASLEAHSEAGTPDGARR